MHFTVRGIYSLRSVEISTHAVPESTSNFNETFTLATSSGGILTLEPQVKILPLSSLVFKMKSRTPRHLESIFTRISHDRMISCHQKLLSHSRYSDLHSELHKSQVSQSDCTVHVKLVRVIVDRLCENSDSEFHITNFE